MSQWVSLEEQEAKTYCHPKVTCQHSETSTRSMIKQIHRDHLWSIIKKISWFLIQKLIDLLCTFQGHLSSVSTLDKTATTNTGKTSASGKSGVASWWWTDFFDELLLEKSPKGRKPTGNTTFPDSVSSTREFKYRWERNQGFEIWKLSALKNVIHLPVSQTLKTSLEKIPFEGASKWSVTTNTLNLRFLWIIYGSFE